MKSFFTLLRWRGRALSCYPVCKIVELVVPTANNTVISRRAWMRARNGIRRDLQQLGRGHLPIYRVYIWYYIFVKLIFDKIWTFYLAPRPFFFFLESKPSSRKEIMLEINVRRKNSPRPKSNKAQNKLSLFRSSRLKTIPVQALNCNFGRKPPIVYRLLY